MGNKAKQSKKQINGGNKQNNKKGKRGKINKTLKDNRITQLYKTK